MASQAIRQPIRTGPFKRTDRLLRPADFKYVLRHGQRVGVRSFVIFVADRAESGGDAGVRLGMTVSRRVGGAVVRNRLKRRVREWFRRERARMQGNLDIVVIARPLAAELSEHEVSEALAEGARVLGVAR